MEHVIRLARETTLKQGGHTPMLIVEGSRGAVIGLVEDSLQTHEDRRRWMFSAGMALAQSNQVGALERIFFVSEGWLSQPAEDGTLQLPPSQDPNRQEVLFVSSLELPGRRTDLILYEMVRDHAGQLIDLKEFEAPGAEDGSSADSPLLNSFVAGFGAGCRMKLN